MTENTNDKTPDNADLDWHLSINERLTNIDKNQSEIHKNYAELRKTNSVIDKNRIETALTSKKVFWFEVSLIFILIGVGIAIAKVFLK